MYIYDIHLFQAALWHIFSIWCISAAKAERDCIKGKKGTQTVRNNRPKLVQALVCQARCEIPLGTELLVGLKSFCNPKPIQFSLQHFFFHQRPNTAWTVYHAILPAFPLFAATHEWKRNPFFIYSGIKNALKLLAFKAGKFASGEPWSCLSSKTG